MGALIAGRPGLASAFEAYGAALGEAFQLRDDLLDVFGDERVTGKTGGLDLAQRKMTLLLTLARPDHEEITDPLSGEDADLPRVRRLLASAQSTRTRVVKELRSGAEASVVAGVLETGPAGVLLSGDDLADLGPVAAALRAGQEERRELVPLEVMRAAPAGMGHRGCVDTASLFGPDEGMLVGSTSAGGVLVCAEVHHLPYMNLRPFRVNAGAVHSYVFGPTATAYITELRAGERAYAVRADGRFREVLVGRLKVELRPLRLIVARHGDVEVNVLLQDDWHVRVMSEDHQPLNLTEVRAGSQLLGYVCEPGRHVGIKVTEQISEF